MVFAQTLFTRAVDPVIPMIAESLDIDVATAALLSSAYTFPYALVQPALGVTGDFLGKTPCGEDIPRAVGAVIKNPPTEALSFKTRLFSPKSSFSRVDSDYRSVRSRAGQT